MAKDRFAAFLARGARDPCLRLEAANILINLFMMFFGRLGRLNVEPKKKMKSSKFYCRKTYTDSFEECFRWNQYKNNRKRMRISGLMIILGHGGYLLIQQV